jgi:hypothetical protein
MTDPQPGAPAVTGVTRWRKRPVEIEARQFTAGNGADIAAWCGGRYFPEEPLGRRHHPVIEVHTLEGALVAHPGNWIIRGVKGEFYPCREDIFAATYEPADGPTIAAAGSGSDDTSRVAPARHDSAQRHAEVSEAPPVAADFDRVLDRMIAAEGKLAAIAEHCRQRLDAAIVQGPVSHLCRDILAIIGTEEEASRDR